jgi:hypothetical protein
LEIVKETIPQPPVTMLTNLSEVSPALAAGLEGPGGRVAVVTALLSVVPRAVGHGLFDRTNERR